MKTMKRTPNYIGYVCVLCVRACVCRPGRAYANNKHVPISYAWNIVTTQSLSYHTTQEADTTQ